MEKWFYTANGEQAGPVTAEALRDLETQGVLNSASLVWCQDLPAWTPLGLVPAHLLPGGAVAVPPSLSVAGGPEQVHAFEFRGRAGEFFRIWIVNVVLTVLTLGIYAAWAKVRTRRYFYGNTLLDGKPFDFTANPIAILKGNLIFGGLFILYTIAGAVFPPLALLVMLVIGALAPWLEQARAAAANTPCDAPELKAAAQTAQDAYRGFVVQNRIDLGAWRGDRTHSGTANWRLAQYQSNSDADAVLGLYGTLADARFVVMTHFADGTRPYAARLLVRNAGVVDAGLINRAERTVTRTAPLGFTRATTLSFGARDSADVDVALRPEVRSNIAGFSASGDYVGKNVTSEAVRFDLPTAAWRAMAPLDPREDVVVEFDCDDGPRYMRFEVGDFLTGLSFVRLPSPYGQPL